MPVTEVFQSWGSWSVRLKGLPDDATPSEVWRALDPDTNAFGHIVITPTRVDPVAEGDASMLAKSRYTGVYRGGGSRDEIGGVGLVSWLADEEGKGEIFLLPVEESSFADWVPALLPDAIEEGTVHAIAGTFSQSFRYVTPLYALHQVMDYFGGVFRVNPDGTLDAGEESDLFATTPEVLLTWQGSGPDTDADGIRGTQIDLARDAEEWTSELHMFAEGQGTTVHVASSLLPSANPYKDLHGNAAVRGLAVDAPDVPASAAATLAAAEHARINTPRKAYSLSSDEGYVTMRIRGTKRVEPGDYIYVYDPRPDAKLYDRANQVTFQGKTIMPVTLQLEAVTWPIEEGMGVYFRYYDGSTPVWVDLTEHVVFEGSQDAPGTTTLDVGALPRTLTDGPSPVQIQARVAAAGVLGYAERTTNQTGISSETDLTGLSVTVSVLPGRRIRITASLNIRQRTAPGLAIVRIKEGSTNLRRHDHQLGTDDFATVQVSRILESPTAGSHTYKLAAQTTAGTVDTQADNTTTHGPASILVEDLGPA